MCAAGRRGAVANREEAERRRASAFHHLEVARDLAVLVSIAVAEQYFSCDTSPRVPPDFA
jgi:hypothetical protein